VYNYTLDENLDHNVSYTVVYSGRNMCEKVLMMITIIIAIAVKIIILMLLNVMIIIIIRIMLKIIICLHGVRTSVCLLRNSTYIHVYRYDNNDEMQFLNNTL